MPNNSCNDPTEKDKMDFLSFSESKKWHDKIPEDISCVVDESIQGGYVYAGNLYIELVSTDHCCDDDCRSYGCSEKNKDDEYLLIIGNQQFQSKNLDELEKILFQFGKSEDII